MLDILGAHWVYVVHPCIESTVHYSYAYNRFDFAAFRSFGVVLVVMWLWWLRVV